MNGILVIVGYSRKSYIRIAREFASDCDFALVCVYMRKPMTENKQSNLMLYDHTVDISTNEGREWLRSNRDSVRCITCTQERDMDAYIDALLYTGKISKNQHSLYTALIDKRKFKEVLQKKCPELVPSVFDIELGDLDTTTFPLVAKPTGLAGSSYVKVIRDTPTLQSYIKENLANLKNNGREFFNKEISIIGEEFLEGPQYSANIYVDVSGKITICPIVRVIPAYDLNTDDTYNAIQYTTDELTNEEYKALKKAIMTIVNIFEIRLTSAHFDCVKTPHGWKFFEVGLRIGGNRQKLFEYSHAMNHFRNDLLNRLGYTPLVNERTRTSAIIQKASSKCGVLSRVQYERSFSAKEMPLLEEKKIKKLGEEVKPLSDGGGTITRHILYGEHHETVIEESKSFFEKIKFEVSS